MIPHEVTDVLPSAVLTRINNMSDEVKKSICELRLRSNKPICVTAKGKNIILDYICKTADIKEIFNRACKYSIHTYQNQINCGFITLDGGHRVGICGDAVKKNGEIINIVNISSLNIRIARRINNCADKIIEFYASHGFSSTVIIGPPASGKTTIIRELADCLSQKYRVCVIDERNEICSEDIGIMCDCMHGYDKAVGIEIAVRAMSPQIVIFDEIGTEAELEKISQLFSSGVDIITTAHCSNVEDLFRRSVTRKLFGLSVFKYYIFLSTDFSDIKILTDNELTERMKCSVGGDFSRGMFSVGRNAFC